MFYLATKQFRNIHTELSPLARPVLGDCIAQDPTIGPGVHLAAEWRCLSPAGVDRTRVSRPNLPAGFNLIDQVSIEYRNKLEKSP